MALPYHLLAIELDTDPLARGYSGMTDEQAATSLSATDRTIPKQTMSGSEVLNAVDNAEWTALTDAERRTVFDVCHLGEQLNPFGVEATLMIGVFGGGSTTITNLAAARNLNVSRSQEIGFAPVARASDVQIARAL
jgi:hypothetical protein